MAKKPLYAQVRLTKENTIRVRKYLASTPKEYRWTLNSAVNELISESIRKINKV